MYDFKYLSVLFGLVLMIATPVLAEPVAKAEVYPTEGFVPLTVSLDASRSQGDIEEYEWTVSSSGKELIILYSKETSLLLDQAGEYTISLKVTDENDVSDTQEVATVTAKGFQACFEASRLEGMLVKDQPLKVTLDASCSTGQHIIDYHWEVNGRPTTQRGPKITHSFYESGNYTISLRVEESRGEISLPFRQTLTIKTLIAKAVASPTQVVIGETIELDATQSQPKESLDDLKYKWYVELPPESSQDCEEITPIFDDQIASNPTLLFLGSMDKKASCHYTITLQITDREGVTSEDSVTIEVGPKITRPQAKINSVSPQKGFAPLILNLDGSDSYDEDGNITQYTWLASHDEGNFGFEKSTSSPQTTFTIEKSGTYTISLFVTDNDDENSDKVVFKNGEEVAKIEIANERPIANAKVLPSNEKPEGIPLAVILDGSDSRDNDGKLEKYTWTITNESGYDETLESEEPTISHLLEVGLYQFSLVVTDNNGVDSEPNVISYQIAGSLSIEPQTYSFSLPKSFVPKTEASEPSASESEPLPATRRIPKRAEYWPGRVIVKFREGASSQIRASIREFYQAQFINAFSSMNGEVWQVEDVEAAIATQSRRVFSEIVSIRPDYVIRAQDIRAMNDKLWRKSRDKKDDTPSIETKDTVLCAVLDSGVDYNHPDLKPYIWTNSDEIPDNNHDDDGNGYVDDVHGYDFVNDDGDPEDDCGHGTHVAGILAGLANKNENAGITLSGYGWPAKILALKILKLKKNSSGIQECLGSDSSAIFALEYVQKNAKKMGIKCTNNSWGGETDPNTDLENAIQTEANEGRLFIVASGNSSPRQDNDNIASYPANYDSENVISVCSVKHKDQLSLFSSFGKQTVDLCALGEKITSTYPSNRYETLHGTSMAAPYVTGAVTLLWSVFPDLTAYELKSHLLASVKKIDALKDKNATSGRLNLGDAIEKMNSRRQTFTITNMADMAVQIEKVMLVDNHGDELSTEADFKIRHEGCSKKPLAPNKVCTVEVFFAPSFTDKKEVFLKVSSNMPVSQQVTATLHGEITNDKIGAFSWNPLSCSLDYEGEMSTELAEPSIYNLETGELEIPSVALLTEEEGIDEKGIGIFEVKLCPNSGKAMHYDLCGFTPLKSKPKLGDTTVCTDKESEEIIVNLPIVRIVPNTNLLYEVYMNILTNSDGESEFVLKEVIPIH